MIIKHKNCKLIYLDNDKIIPKDSVDLNLIDDFMKVNKELKFLLDIKSRFNNYQTFKRLGMKDSDNFLYYNKNLRDNIKKYLDPIGYENVKSSMYFYDNYIKNKTPEPYMKILQAFELFERFEIIVDGNIKILSKDLIEPIIEE